MVEIIVVDDASEPPLCDEDWAAANRCRRCASRQGVARTRNLGASLARGRVLLFLECARLFFGQHFRRTAEQWGGKRLRHPRLRHAIVG